ncbi:MAG: DUF4956 domain-containing protein [Lachnospiraceae bacterium]|nr:DUF4956 domain-containing protein [Lachnospiraceae bacterium]MDY5648530.1 DUF4956 domain-containing protein [Lachnospiraceae bacterium]
MNFKDVFKKSFLEGFTSMDISTSKIIATLAMVVILSLYIFFIYRVVTRKTFYSKTFNISLAAIAIITAGIILAMQSNLVISLGMVGALSIVRFRTAIKDPMDLIFLFWAISIGIICGGGLYEVAVITSIIVTVCLLGLDLLPVARTPMLLVVNASDVNAEEKVMEIAGKYSRICRVKSRNITGGREDLIIEVRVKEERELVRAISELEGVDYVSLLAHDGEVTF